jgi:exonuclease I
MVIAAYFLQNERHKMPNFKLETVAKQYSLTVDRPGFHDALSDIRITGQILKMAELY